MGTTGLYSGAGPTLLEMLEEDLDEAVDALMYHVKRTPGGITMDRKYAEGVAYGLARAVAIIRSPYDVDAGLATARGQAMIRYEDRNYEPGGTQHDEADPSSEAGGGGEGDR